MRLCPAGGGRSGGVSAVGAVLAVFGFLAETEFAIVAFVLFDVAFDGGGGHFVIVLLLVGDATGLAQLGNLLAGFPHRAQSGLMAKRLLAFQLINQPTGVGQRLAG